jgi:hypothetical protein
MDAVARRAIRGEGTTEAEWHRWPGLARLPAIDLRALVPAGSRAVVVAPHPDDEVLSVGGLLAQLADNGTPVEVIAVTDGTASHSGSTEWPAERLAQARPRESLRALRRLGLSIEPARLGLPDGGLKEMRACWRRRLVSLLRPRDVVFTTWRQDGHPTTRSRARPARWPRPAPVRAWSRCRCGAGTGRAPAMRACHGRTPFACR